MINTYGILRVAAKTTIYRAPMRQSGDSVLLGTSDPGVLKNSKILFASFKKM